MARCIMVLPQFTDISVSVYHGLWINLTEVSNPPVADLEYLQRLVLSIATS